MTTHGTWYSSLLFHYPANLETVILFTRLYAMYRCSKRVLVFFVSMFCLEIAALGVLVGMPPPTAVGEFRISLTPIAFQCVFIKFDYPFIRFVDFKLKLKPISFLVYFAPKSPVLTKPNRIPGTNNYSPGLFICADGDAPHQHWIAYYWTCALSVDTILLLMAMYKAWAYRKCPNKYNLMRVLAWDSIIYFVVWVLIYSKSLRKHGL